MIALLINDWRLGLAALVVLPPAIVLSRWFQRTSTRAQFEVRTRIASVTAHIAESVGGMVIVQSFRRQRAFRARFDELNDANRHANVYAQRIVSVFFPSIELLGVISTVAVLAVGAHILPSNQIGTLAAAYFLLSLAFQPLQSLSEVYSQMQSGQAAMTKISLVLEEDVEIASPEAATVARASERRACDSKASGSPTASTRCFTESTSRSRSGTCYAIVGESGGGKSTLAKLAARFYDPTAGSGDGRRLSTCAGSISAPIAGSWASCYRTSSSSRARSPTTSDSPRPRPSGEELERIARSSGSTGSPPASRPAFST